MQAVSAKPVSFGDDPIFDPHSPPPVTHAAQVAPTVSTTMVQTPQVVMHVDPVVQTPVVQAVPTSVVHVTPTVQTSANVIYTQPVGPSCNLSATPWPVIIISMVGAIFTVYTAVAPNIDSNRRVFGVVLLILWTVIWALLLWVLWRECRQSTSWWLLLIPLTAMILFLVLIIILNLGA